MHIDVAKLDQQLTWLQREISRLVEIDSPWANRDADVLTGIAETLRQLRQDKQMTTIGGKRLSDNGTD